MKHAVNLLPRFFDRLFIQAELCTANILRPSIGESPPFLPWRKLREQADHWQGVFRHLHLQSLVIATALAAIQIGFL